MRARNAAAPRHARETEWVFMVSFPDVLIVKKKDRLIDNCEDGPQFVSVNFDVCAES